MDTINIDDFLENDIIKEDSFRKIADNHNWKIYKNKKILIKGCASVPIPTWAYMILVSKLTPYAKKFYSESYVQLMRYIKNTVTASKSTS